MAVYDDARGVWFTIQDIRKHYPELMDQVEFIVVDNNPNSSHGEATKDYVENWVNNGRYIPFEKRRDRSATGSHLPGRKHTGSALYGLACAA